MRRRDKEKTMNEEKLYCVCGHTDEEHYNDGGDSTAKYGCEAGNNDGSLCRCEDFTHPFEPISEEI